MRETRLLSFPLKLRARYEPFYCEMAFLPTNRIENLLLMKKTISFDVKKNSRLDDFLIEILPSVLGHLNSAAEISPPNLIRVSCGNSPIEIVRPRGRIEHPRKPDLHGSLNPKDEFFASENEKFLSNSKIRRLIFSGNVLVENNVVKNPAFILRNSSRVKILFDSERIFFEKQNGDIDFSLCEKDVVFEDDFLLAVNKPSGLPSEKTFLESRASLLDAARKYLCERNPDLENYCSLVHRLDKGTSGVILFSKKKYVNAALHEMFGSGEGRVAKKIYLAICTKNTAGSASAFLRGAKNIENEIDFGKEEFSVRNFLGRVSKKSQAAKFGEMPQSCGGKFARTDFRILEKSAGKILVQARLFTGRTHQIRAHLSQCGMPVLGDTLYGGESASRIFLHARSLELPHPVTGEILKLLSPVPEEFKKYFTNFAECK